MKRKLISAVLVMCIILSFVNISIIAVSATTNINIGDYIQMGTYYGEPILWRCVDIDENGPLILSDKIICMKVFDAIGNNFNGSHGRGYNNGIYRQKYGSNYWADSNIFCWLNSDATAGNVEWLCGNPPDNEHVYNNVDDYSDEAGFLTNFNSLEKNYIKSVVQKSILDACEYSSNKNLSYHKYNKNMDDVLQNYDIAYSESIKESIFLLDVKQIYNVYKNGNILGENYYLAKPTVQAIQNSEIVSEELSKDNNYPYWLRTPDAEISIRSIHGYSDDVRYIDMDGSVNHNGSARSSKGVRPAFYLTDDAKFPIGNGSESSPFRTYYQANYRSNLIENASLTFDYSDKYFTENDGYTYNHDLAKATLALELSSYTAKGTDNLNANAKMTNIYSLYKQLGFDMNSIDQHNYECSLDDNSDKVAYSFATKKLYDGSTLVAVVVRGGGYGAEWRSNFHVGIGNMHYGFAMPALNVYADLLEYTKDMDKSKLKLWITGYSRGAAVANILSGKINEDNLINRNNLYSYLFAVPKGVKVTETDAHNSMHNNIYNLVLPYDFVPTVAFEKWGFGRYGQTLMVKNIPWNLSEYQQGGHEKYFREFTGRVYSMGPDVSKAAIKAANAICNFAVNQTEYATVLQGFFMDIIEWAMCRMKKESLSEFINGRYSVSSETWQEMKNLAVDYTVNSNSTIIFVGNDKIRLEDIICLMHLNGIDVYDDLYNNVLKKIVKAIIGINTSILDVGSTMEAHNPEYYIAWLYGYDNPSYIYEASTYKKLTIACPVNVNVYNSYGELVASVVDNKVVVDTLPVEVIGESAEIYFYEGEDIDDYTVEIEAYDEGEVNYSVTEYENNGVETRKINYSNIPVSTGTKLTGNVPKGQKLEAELYDLTSLTNDEENNITFTDDLTGEHLQNLTIGVTVEGDGLANDIYFATKGELVTLKANPYYDASFIGWYNENEELISEDREYSFILSESMNVTAKFTKCTAVVFTMTPKISNNKLNISSIVSSAKDIDAQYIMTIYSGNNKLIDTKIIPVLLVGNTEKEVNETFNVSLLESTPAYAKLFLWSDLDNLIPLCSSTKADIQ